MSNFISSANDRKRKKQIKLTNYTIQHNETESIDRFSYSLNPIYQITSIINSATDGTSIKFHKIYKDNQESLNKRLLQAYLQLGDLQIYIKL